MLTDNIIIAIALFATALLVGLVLFYYYSFILGRKPAKWKQELKVRLRKIAANGYDQERNLPEYDKLLAWALQKRFSNNLSLGENLKQQSKRFTKRQLDDIWRAHKLRNKLAHEIDFSPSPSQLNQAVIILKRHLSDQAKN